MSPAPDSKDSEAAGLCATDLVRQWDERLNRLSDEVGTIQVQLSEKRKPWYRQTSLVVSIASLLFSILFNTWTRSTDAVNKSNESLQAIVAQLADLRGEEAKDALSAKTDFLGYSNRAGIRNNKRIALLDHADSALKTANYQVSSAILVTLGYEVAIDGQYRKAETYYQLGAEKANPNTNEKMWALFADAQLRLLPDSPLYNPKEGRERYQQALNQVKTVDDSSRYQRGQVLARIAQLESLSRDGTALSQQYYERASAEAKGISQLNPYHEMLNQWIAMARQSSTATGTVTGIGFSQNNGWLGQWKLKYPKSGQAGTVTFLSVSPNVTGAYVDVFADGKLVEKEIGQVAILDDKRIRVDWTAQRPVPVPMQTAGYSLIRAEAVGPSMSGEQYAFGEKAVPIRLSR
jgi:hypothetical protein